MRGPLCERDGRAALVTLGAQPLLPSPRAMAAPADDGTLAGFDSLEALLEVRARGRGRDAAAAAPRPDLGPPSPARLPPSNRRPGSPPPSWLPPCASCMA